MWNEQLIPEIDVKVGVFLTNDSYVTMMMELVLYMCACVSEDDSRLVRNISYLM